MKYLLCHFVLYYTLSYDLFRCSPSLVLMKCIMSGGGFLSASLPGFWFHSGTMVSLWRPARLSLRVSWHLGRAGKMCATLQTSQDQTRGNWGKAAMYITFFFFFQNSTAFVSPPISERTCVDHNCKSELWSKLIRHNNVSFLHLVFMNNDAFMSLS